MTDVVDSMIDKLKSQGLFDKIRKSCLADLENMDEYHALMEDTNEFVGVFLSNQIWPPVMNKMELREELRKRLSETQNIKEKFHAVVKKCMSLRNSDEFLPQINRAVSDYFNITVEEIYGGNNRKNVKLMENSDDEMELDSLGSPDVSFSTTETDGHIVNKTDVPDTLNNSFPDLNPLNTNPERPVDINNVNHRQDIKQSRKLSPEGRKFHRAVNDSRNSPHNKSSIHQISPQYEEHSSMSHQRDSSYSRNNKDTRDSFNHRKKDMYKSRIEDPLDVLSMRRRKSSSSDHSYSERGHNSYQAKSEFHSYRQNYDAYEGRGQLREYSSDYRHKKDRNYRNDYYRGKNKMQPNFETRGHSSSRYSRDYSFYQSDRNLRHHKISYNKMDSNKSYHGYKKFGLNTSNRRNRSPSSSPPTSPYSRRHMGTFQRSSRHDDYDSPPSHRSQSNSNSRVRLSSTDKSQNHFETSYRSENDVLEQQQRRRREIEARLREIENQQRRMLVKNSPARATGEIESIPEEDIYDPADLNISDDLTSGLLPE